MLIQVMTFEIHDFTTNVSEKFVVENTEDNQNMVFTHRFTRNIRFDSMFSFQFEKEMSMPLEFISMDTWMRIVSTTPELISA